MIVLSGHFDSWSSRSLNNILSSHPWFLYLHSWLTSSMREATTLFVDPAGILCLHVGHDVILADDVQLWQMMCPEEQLEIGILRGIVKHTGHCNAASISDNLSSVSMLYFCEYLLTWVSKILTAHARIYANNLVCVCVCCYVLPPFVKCS